MYTVIPTYMYCMHVVVHDNIKENNFKKCLWNTDASWRQQSWKWPWPTDLPSNPDHLHMAVHQCAKFEVYGVNSSYWLHNGQVVGNWLTCRQTYGMCWAMCSAASTEDITRGATVTGCAPVVTFCCKGFISMISKVKMQEKIQRDWNSMT